MIVKPQYFREPAKLEAVRGHVVQAVDLGVRGVGLLRGVLFGLVALPALCTALMSGLCGEFSVFLTAGGFAIFALWRAKRHIARALAGR